MLRVARKRLRAARAVRGKSRRRSSSGRAWIWRAYSRASSGRMRAPGAIGTRSRSRSARSCELERHLAPMMKSAQRQRMNSHSCSGSLMITHQERSWTYSGFCAHLPGLLLEHGPGVRPHHERVGHVHDQEGEDERRHLVDEVVHVEPAHAFPPRCPPGRRPRRRRSPSRRARSPRCRPPAGAGAGAAGAGGGWGAAWSPADARAASPARPRSSDSDEALHLSTSVTRRTARRGSPRRASRPCRSRGS